MIDGVFVLWSDVQGGVFWHVRTRVEFVALRGDDVSSTTSDHCRAMDLRDALKGPRKNYLIFMYDVCM